MAEEWEDKGVFEKKFLDKGIIAARDEAVRKAIQPYEKSLISEEDFLTLMSIFLDRYKLLGKKHEYLEDSTKEKLNALDKRIKELEKKAKPQIKYFQEELSLEDWNMVIDVTVPYKKTFWGRIKNTIPPEETFNKKHPFLHSFGFSSVFYDTSSGWKSKSILSIIGAVLYPAEFAPILFTVFFAFNIIDFTGRLLFRLIRKTFSSQGMRDDFGAFFSRYFYVVCAAMVYVLSESASQSIGEKADFLFKYGGFFILKGTIIYFCLNAVYSLIEQAGHFIQAPSFLNIKRLKKASKKFFNTLKEDEDD